MEVFSFCLLVNQHKQLNVDKFVKYLILILFDI